MIRGLILFPSFHFLEKPEKAIDKSANLGYNMHHVSGAKHLVILPQSLSGMRGNIPPHPQIPRGYGGIGRRVGFRIRFPPECRFKSCYPHNKKRSSTAAPLFVMRIIDDVEPVQRLSFCAANDGPRPSRQTCYRSEPKASLGSSTSCYPPNKRAGLASTTLAEKSIL